VLVEVKVPVLAESVAEATLLNWQKKVGDVVSRGDSLIDIETDKVTLEVAAPNNGVLAEILKQDGEDVQSDEVIARIETEAGKAEVPAEKPESAAEPEPEPEGKPEPSPEPAQPAAARKETPAPLAPEQQSMPGMESPAHRLSPAVRNLLQQHQLRAEDIDTADSGGRITKEDVLNHIAKSGRGKTPEKAAEPPAKESPAPPPETGAAPAKESVEMPQPAPEKKETVAAPEKTAAPPTPASPKPGEPQQKETPKPAPAAPPKPGGARPEKRVPMTRLRKRAAERLLMAQRENAILTTFNEVNMQPVIELRNRYKQEFEETHGVKLGFMSFFTKATVEALKKFPIINASVDGEDIIYHGYFDIGIAVSSPRGLVVPIIRDADTLSFAQIESTIRGLGEKAHNGKLTMDDLTGGTFTITNGGVFGSMLSTPIINPPQSAILGMHKMQNRPVAEDGEVVIRPIMYLALSYDHRIIDGREAVQFLVAIKEQIEEPTRLLLQV